MEGKPRKLTESEVKLLDQLTISASQGRLAGLVTEINGEERVVLVIVQEDKTKQKVQMLPIATLLKPSDKVKPPQGAKEEPKIHIAKR